MDRRDALTRMSLLLGGSIIGAPAFLSGCSPYDHSSFAPFTPDQIELLNELGEVIIPTTSDSEGAKAANVGEFMNTIVSDFYNEEEQNLFIAGLSRLENEAFSLMNQNEKIDFAMMLEQEASNTDKPTSYLMMKQLTIWGYLTSEPGLTGLFDFAPVPGQYIPTVKYTPGDKVMHPRVADWQARSFANFHSS
ncbi:MAG: gluconate 2-dehydrogenase subunit 3 family protein [Balneolaceae bacterium]|nr:gluconate 2-dehydrogenase subunit 3 family protein [Balneolaceae bacterium]MBO6545775.1 gluconate 2-dehydrogenase subunit 3 family protein [Balneolaceae bacterium]MBO6647171.1 gluconate 2-dehydrogenase subunit 3 family protein [Balneolaceae bacterium]